MADPIQVLVTYAGTLSIGGDLRVHRLGLGAMRITGPGIFGPPKLQREPIEMLRRAVRLGINFIDTADSYGPEISEKLIAQALYPYPRDLVIATKGGLTRPGPDIWESNARPDHLRAAVEGSLRRLRLERIDLYQLHRPDPKVPLEESLGALVELQRAGKIRHIGISNVTLDEFRRARNVAGIVSVQNRYNIEDRSSEPLVDECERLELPFLPWAPLDRGAAFARLEEVARKYHATPRQIAIAWLLKRSPIMLPIPGTSSIAHLEENVRAAAIELSDADFKLVG
jgi:pyridoxine 4-dehydrogenase